MKKIFHKLLIVLTSALLTIPIVALAQDYYQASGIPVQRSAMSSAEFRTEFSSIESDISDKLPDYSGNGDNFVKINVGGTALTSVTNSQALAALGLEVGVDVQAFDDELLELAGLANTDSNFIVGNGTVWVAESGATVRTSLGLGALATAALIDDDDWDTADLAIGNGGTGSSTAGDARTALGLAIGSNVQAYDSVLTDFAALNFTNSNFIVGNGSTFVVEIGSVARTSLGLGSLATLSAIDDDNWDTTDLAVANGGTGSSTAGDARTALGLAIGSDVQAWDTILDSTTAAYTTSLNTKLGGIQALADVTDAAAITAAGAPIISSGSGSPVSTPDVEGDIYIDTTADTSWIATGTASSADWKQASGLGGGDLIAANNLSDVASDVTSRVNLNVEYGVDVQAFDADLDAIAALAKTNNNFIVANGTVWALETPTSARSSLGLGPLATASTVDGGDWSGTDLAVADGGTGSSNAAAARIALEVEYGVDVHAFDSSLDDLAGLSTSDSNFIVGSASGWVVESGSTARSSIGAQASDSDLTAIAALSKTNNNFMVANGSAWVLETPSAVRTSLGLVIGTNVQAHDAVLDSTTASYTTSLNTKLGNIETLADVTDASNVAAAGAPIITTGSGSPGSTPATEGDIYIDTTADTSWLATGTVSSADWKQASGLGGGDLLASNNLNDVQSASTSRSNLGLAIGSNVQAFDTELLEIAGLANTNNNFIVGTGTVWALESATSARTSLGLGALAQLSNVDNGDWSGTDLSVANGGTGASTLTGLLSGNGVGAITGGATIDGGDWNGTDLSVANGGTGSSSDSAARVALNVEYGVDVQAYDADLLTIAGLAKTNNNFIVGDGVNWALETPTNARGSLGLGSLATLSTINGGNWNGTDLSIANGGTGSSTDATARQALNVEYGVDVQAFDADLTTIAGLAKTNNNFIVGNGSNWALETPSAARTSLALGSLATLSTINNGNWSGTDLTVGNGGTGAGTLTGLLSGNGTGAITGSATINNGNWNGTDLALANGGTGSSTAAGAATNLGVGTGSSPQFANVNLGHASDTTISRDSAGKIAVEGRPVLMHDNAALVSARIVITATTPTDLTGMATGDFKFVY